jgi:hypothetical protein
MKHFLTTLLLATVCATGYGQTLKSVMIDTNGVQVNQFGSGSATNPAIKLGATNWGFWRATGPDRIFVSVNGSTGVTFTSNSVAATTFSGNLSGGVSIGAGQSISFGGGANVSGTRSNLGATTLGDAIFTATNQVSARQALGLQAYTNTLTNSVGTVEIGSTVSNVTVGWTISPTNATYALRQLVGAGATNTITNNASTLAFSNLSLSNDTTWTLTVGDGQGVTNTATTAVLFQNYMIWGRSTNTTLDNAALQSLHTSGGGANRAFSTSRNRSITLDGGGQYLYIAYPAGFGAATFTVGGLPNSAWTVATNSYTNASGYATNYLIYRTDTIQNGTGINIVVQ